MTKRNLPVAAISTRPGLRSEIAPTALERWNPDVRAAAPEADEAENSISIFDVIGQDFWTGEGVTVKRIDAALRQIGNKDVTVNINSPGGNYFEGLAIYNRFLEHPAKVTVKILGVAASAASVIAMAGDDIQIARAAWLMIHNTWVLAGGDRHALREVADWLEPFDKMAVDIYAARTGLKDGEIAKMLDRETWVGGSDAVDKGFADSLLSSSQVTSDPNNSLDQRPVAAAHKVDGLLARLNVPRSERRQLIQALKGGTPGAAASATQDAGLIVQVESLLAKFKSL